MLTATEVSPLSHGHPDVIHDDFATTLQAGWCGTRHRTATLSIVTTRAITYRVGARHFSKYFGHINSVL